MKISNIVGIVAAVVVVGWVAHKDYQLARAAEARVVTLERKVDSLEHEAARNRVVIADISGNALEDPIGTWATVVRIDSAYAAKHATMRFTLDDSSVVVGNWSDMSDKLWRIRAAEPITEETK